MQHIRKSMDRYGYFSRYSKSLGFESPAFIQSGVRLYFYNSPTQLIYRVYEEQRVIPSNDPNHLQRHRQVDTSRTSGGDLLAAKTLLGPSISIVRSLATLNEVVNIDFWRVFNWLIVG